MLRIRHAVLWFAAVHGAACGNSSDDSTNGDGSSGAGAVGGSGGSSGSSGAAGTDAGGSAGSSGSAGSTGTPASCEAICARYQEECAMPDENCGVCSNAVYHVPECNPPYWAFYDCLAAHPAFELDCSPTFFYQQPRGDVCLSEYAEYAGCSLTMGEDCRAEPEMNPNCAGDPANPPNFVYCRTEATPPPGCVLFASSHRTGVIMYCCP